MLNRELRIRARSLSTPYSHRALTAGVHGACKQKEVCPLVLENIAVINLEELSPQHIFASFLLLTKQLLLSVLSSLQLTSYIQLSLMPTACMPAGIPCMVSLHVQNFTKLYLVRRYDQRSCP